MALEDKVTICSKCKMQWLYKPDETPIRTTCSRCNSPVIHTNITAEEMFLIERISEDRDFLNAMIELKKNNIIEYQTKIAQYRQIAKADGCYDKPKPKICCPKCGSESITTGQRGYSLLTGFLGSNKTVNRCANCGYKWTP